MIQSNLKVEETIKQAITKCYICVLCGDYSGYNQPSQKPLKWCWSVISCDIGSDLVLPLRQIIIIIFQTSNSCNLGSR